MIRLAIPNKGRMNTEVLKLLEKIGLDIPENGRKLYTHTNNPNIHVVYARAADIPLYVQAGAADIGITGEDMIQESEAKVEKLLPLRFGRCQIVVATPQNSEIQNSEGYMSNLRVATKLPGIAKKYFKSMGVRCKIIRISGAIELAPYLKIADVIVDQVSTGTTLAMNNLRIVDTIFESKIYLIANKKVKTEKKVEMDELKIAIESVITAETKRYVIANVKGKEILERVIKVLPTMESPTVLPLAKPGEYAIQSVVDSVQLIPTMRKLKQAGAKDILIMNMARVVE
jgi:ATP phosphoribosyltransferase